MVVPGIISARGDYPGMMRIIIWFLGWIISLGEGVKIISPDEVVEQMKEEIERLQRQYTILKI